MIDAGSNRAVQDGIRRVYDEASDYYRQLRWEKNRLARFEYDLTRQTIEEELGASVGERGLELGCGPGTWTPLLVSRTRGVTAVDISGGMLEQARKALASEPVTFVQGDAAAAPIEGEFDRAMSIRMLEYTPEWAKIVARLGDLVVPGGRAVVITKTKVSVWRGTGRERWFVTYPRRLARFLIKGPRRRDFWQRHIPVRAMIAALRDAGFTEIRVRPVIFGLPIFMRGTKQYPIVPEFLEMPVLRAEGAVWRWVSKRGPALRWASLLFSESYAVSARKV
ncbi:MAG: class I SAM-dependent methyltransferase [Candidatus Dormibacteraeota bacterium]|nr:class I SAM-dependent methyltransferase [Candidatus Dormibacteraeota bacterium]